MSHSLALYNAHKRATLDRLTLTYQLRVRSLYKLESIHVVGPMTRALDSDHETFDPKIPVSSLDAQLYTVFSQFQSAVILAGFSDGLREVAPDGKLNLWEKFPLHMPIEDTISLQGGSNLVDKRQDLLNRFKDKKAQDLKERLHEYVETSKSDYLKNVRKAYASASRTWLKGQGSTDDVRAFLRKALISTDADSERTLRTETTNYFNETRADYFKTDTDVDFVELYAVTDGRISKICDDRHGFCVPIGQATSKKYMPAFHPHCRTIQRPLFSYLPSHKIIIEKSKLMNEASFTPLPKGWL